MECLRILGLFLVESVTRKALLAAGGAGSAISLASWTLDRYGHVEVRGILWRSNVV